MAKELMLNRCRPEKCPFYKTHACELLAGHTLFDDENIHECPWDTISVFRRQLVRGGQLFFLAVEAPNQYLKSVSYLRKDNPPKVGDMCITLRGGFGSASPGKLLVVDDITERGGNHFIHLHSVFGEKESNHSGYEVTVEDLSDYDKGWYDYLFVYKEAEVEKETVFEINISDEEEE